MAAQTAAATFHTLDDSDSALQDSSNDHASKNQPHCQQSSASPALAFRYPTIQNSPGCHGLKTAAGHQPRWRIATIVTNIYHDILRTWRSVHKSAFEPHLLAPRSQQPDVQPQYNTFSASYTGDEGSYCEPKLPNDNVSVFAAEIGDMTLEPSINLLLICVPVGVATYTLQVPALIVFIVNVMAIVPLSSILTDATERIAMEAGDSVGAFLNISLGNIVELILFLVTLINGHVRIVQVSLLGSILINLLPILGSALITAHVASGDCSLRNTEIQILASLLFVSAFVFAIPTAFRYTFDEDHRINDMTANASRATSLIVLVVYMAYFTYEIQKSSAKRISSEDAAEACVPVTPPPLLHRSSPPLTPGPRTIRFADGTAAKPNTNLYSRRTAFEIGPASIADSADADDEEPRGRSLSGTRGNPSAYSVCQPLFPPHIRRYQSRSISAGSSCSRFSRLSHSSSVMGNRLSLARAGLAKVLSKDRRNTEYNSNEDANAVPSDSRLGALLACFVTLVVASVLLAISARLLAGTLDVVCHRGGLSEAVIGLVILPLASNLSGYLTVVAVAARDNLDLAVAVSAGSAIQIALCVAPLTVLAGWLLGRPMMLALNIFEMSMLLGAVFLVNMLVLADGREEGRRVSFLRGGILCACYLVLSITACFAPDIG